jgi:hypothetical protein
MEGVKSLSRVRMSERDMRGSRLHSAESHTGSFRLSARALEIARWSGPAAYLVRPNQVSQKSPTNPSRAAATCRRPATCPMRRSGRCGAASSRRFLRLLPPPARSPGIASSPSLLPASRSTDSPIRAYRAVALAAATRFSLIFVANKLIERGL